ncbi:MAG: hypothetical protein M0004_14205 [Actinomycetota bacterium]|nr:hypothetical protein [Actinomycetota bacterium]
MRIMTLRALRPAAASCLAVIGLGVVTLPTTAATAASPGVTETAMAPVTLHGKVIRVTSATSFIVHVGRHRYVVTIDAMTHVTLNHRPGPVRELRAGDDVTVKGPLEMGRVHASSVVANAR